MRKIPTLFRRDPGDRRYVLPEVTPGCAWVLAGEGAPTRKYDGTCVMLDESGRWWARREVKPGKAAPADYRPVETDELTGKTVGWEPVGQSGFARFHAEALAAAEEAGTRGPWPAGTYELIGPKINGNPERSAGHRLVRHQDAEVLTVPGLTFEGIREAVLLQARHGVEGIVWHRNPGDPDTEMAKIKARDFPR